MVDSSPGSASIDPSQLEPVDTRNARVLSTHRHNANERGRVRSARPGERRSTLTASVTEHSLNKRLSRLSAFERSQKLGRATDARRTQLLWRVFRLFDLDDNGYVSKDELFKLGNARQELGQCERVWTQENNARMLARMSGVDSDMVAGECFVKYFLDALSQQSDPRFDQTIEQFIHVGQACRGERSQRLCDASSIEGRILDGSARAGE